MIKIENAETYGWEAAIRGMRNPKNSWDRSDSCTKGPFYCSDYCCNHVECKQETGLVIGPNDYNLMKTLRNAGTDHRKFMRMIMVSVDITAPLYWWKEFDTYKVGTVANSCSTMHKIHAKEFTLDDFSHEHLINTMEEAIPYDSDVLMIFDNDAILCTIVDALNSARDLYNMYDNKLKRDDLTPAERRHATAQCKKFWWQMIQLLPSSYNQKRTVTMNYEVLANIYKSRKTHKLDEWREGFCDWIKSLPYSEFITGEFDAPDSSIWLAGNENK